MKVSTPSNKVWLPSTAEVLPSSNLFKESLTVSELVLNVFNPVSSDCAPLWTWVPPTFKVERPFFKVSVPFLTDVNPVFNVPIFAINPEISDELDFKVSVPFLSDWAPALTSSLFADKDFAPAAIALPLSSNLYFSFPAIIAFALWAIWLICSFVTPFPFIALS